MRAHLALALAVVATVDFVHGQAAWQQLTPVSYVTGPAVFGPNQRVWHLGFGPDGVFRTSSWDGQTWTASTAPTPPPRKGHAMAFDPARNRLVMFGGRDGAGANLFGDLWEFDGVAWLQRTFAPNAPGPRFLHAMTWDAGRNRVVVYGGSSTTSVWSAGLADLWEWNGTAWASRNAVGGPQVIGAALAHDPIANELVRVGGHATQFIPVYPYSQQVVFTDTYSLAATGTQWQHRNATLSPRSIANVAFDPIRARLALAGGISGWPPNDPFGDPWPYSNAATLEWNGVSWVVASPLPKAIGVSSLTWDVARQQLVSVGGQYASALKSVTFTGHVTGWSGDDGVPGSLHTLVHDRVRDRLVGIEISYNGTRTWEWDNATWTLAAGVTVSPRCRFPSAAWDPISQRTLLWNGGDLAALHTNTMWAWDGTNWTPLQPALRPSPRHSVAMATDTRRNVVVLHGGWIPHPSGGETSPNDTWEWNGSMWTQVFVPSPPPPRGSASMTFDTERGECVLQGATFVAAAPTETWVYDGTTWQQRAPVSAALYVKSIAYDTQRERTVLAGKLQNGQTVTYQFDGAAWTTLTTATPAIPTFPNEGIALVHDEPRRRVVAYVDYRLWAFATPWPASATAFGAGCAGSGGALQLVAANLPWLGSTMAGTLAPVAAAAVPFVAFGTSNTTWGGVPLPFALGGVGAPGCDVLAEPAVLTLLASAPTAGWSLVLPSTPVLVGVEVYAQGGVLDAAANPLGVATSNALELTLGIR